VLLEDWICLKCFYIFQVWTELPGSLQVPKRYVVYSLFFLRIFVRESLQYFKFKRDRGGGGFLNLSRALNSLILMFSPSSRKLLNFIPPHLNLFIIVLETYFCNFAGKMGGRRPFNKYSFLKKSFNLRK